MKLARVLVGMLVTAWALSAAALPSVDQVQAEVKQGHYAQAESMMQEVVTAKPGSARAHYVYAEILAHNKHFPEARQQAESAKALDPEIHFTEASKFKGLERSLDREQRASQPVEFQATPAVATVTSDASGKGMPGWIGVVGLAGLAIGVWALIYRRRPAVAGQQGLAPGNGVSPSNMAGTAGAPTMPAYGSGYGPGYGSAPVAGSGWMGVGLAAAGGVAAGMLAERLIDGHHDASSGAGFSRLSDSLGPHGLNDLSPGSTAVDDFQPPIDFGSGDGWGGGDTGANDDAGGGW